MRAQLIYLTPFTGSAALLPITEKVVLGGEYSIRGFDLRSIGPKAIGSPLVIGGNKSLLFNAEYIITIAGPVRLVLFADAGQVRDVGEAFAWKEPVTRTVTTGGPLLNDPLSPLILRDPNAPPLQTQTETLGYYSAFKTSVGAEIRFFMPVLNVPFRLIFAMNPQRSGVLTNNYQPAPKFTFRFAVGSTF
jgi:outer membrane protein insertion porin family